MTIINTQDLTGAALDWAVAKAEGHAIDVDANGTAWLAGLGAHVRLPQFSTDPAEGHPIIEREGIATWKNGDTWRAAHPKNPANGYYDAYSGVLDVSFDDGVLGPTALIAAIRCHVAASLGSTVDVPQEMGP